MATTGMRGIPIGTDSNSSDAGGRVGKVYKFKNIHGDRGTNAGLSSQAQN